MVKDDDDDDDDDDDTDDDDDDDDILIDLFFPFRLSAKFVDSKLRAGNKVK